MDLLVDIDGVVLNWIEGFEKFVKEKGIETTTKKPRDWEMSGWLKHEDPWGLVGEFNSSSKFRGLETNPGAQEVLRELHSRGFQIYAISSCSSSPITQTLREENLMEKVGDVFEEIICLPLGNCKGRTLKRFPRGSFWVEDKYENAVKGAQAGHYSFLFNRYHNRNLPEHPGLKRCNDWYDVKKHIEVEAFSGAY